jgi:hypothetical protein
LSEDSYAAGRTFQIFLASLAVQAVQAVNLEAVDDVVSLVVVVVVLLRNFTGRRLSFYQRTRLRYRQPGADVIKILRLSFTSGPNKLECLSLTAF